MEAASCEGRVGGCREHHDANVEMDRARRRDDVLHRPRPGPVPGARVRDGFLHLLNEIDHEMEVTSHDIVDRTHGLIAERDRSSPTIMLRTWSSWPGSGRYSGVRSHTPMQSTWTPEGRRELSGPVLTAEVDRLLGAVRSVRGVAGVEDRLEVHDRSRDHPASQGGRPRTGKRPELWQATWSPTMRLLAVSTIGFAALRCRGETVGRPGPRHPGCRPGRSQADRWDSSARPSVGAMRSLVATGAPVHDVTSHPSIAVRGTRNRPVIAYQREVYHENPRHHDYETSNASGPMIRSRRRPSR